MGTTLKKKEEVKKPVRALKKTPAKAPVKRIKVEKTIEKKVTVKAPASRTKRKIIEPVPVSVDAPVFVPSSASLRLLEKVEIYTLWYQKHLPDYMAAAAKVGGYAFITIGAVLSSFAYLVDKEIIQNQSAALVCTSAVCEEIPDSALADGAPIISFLNSVPARVETDIDFSISLANTHEVEVTLKALTTGEKISLEPIEKKSDTEYKYLIPVKNLKSGFYTLQAKAKDGETAYIFTGPTFIKPEGVEPEPVPLTSAPEAETLVAEVTEESPEETLEDVTASSTDEVVTTEEKEIEVDTQEETVEETEEVSVSEKRTTSNAPINLTLHTERGSDYVSVVTGEFTPEYVEVYSRVGDTEAALFLGQATPVHGEWVLSLAALELPVAEHLIYASFTSADKSYQTEGVPYNPAYTTSGDTLATVDLDILVQKIELALLASSVTSENRQAYYTYLLEQSQVLFSESDESRFAQSGLISTINAVLTESAPTLNPLLFRYAAAVQGGSPYIIALAEAGLENHYKELASVAAAKWADASAVPAIHTILAQRYQILKDAVENVEEQIKQDTNNLTARDTDGDGISDFDEVAYFKSNPALADTDRDSILDGVEIAQFSDVLTPNLTLTDDARATIDDVTYGEVVEILSVTPLTVQGANNGGESTFVLVNGTTVPYAYVYVLSHTTDTVGVIKANSAGAFSYTLEKPTVDGKHEIVAVLLGSDGEAVASSRPYVFEKSHNRFLTAAAFNSVQDITAESREKSIALYVLVAAVGVITFGFILLMLATQLRHRKDKIVHAH